jgi:hypothetical protein
MQRMLPLRIQLKPTPKTPPLQRQQKTTKRKNIHPIRRHTPTMKPTENDYKTMQQYDHIIMKLVSDVEKLRADLDLRTSQLMKLYKTVGAKP